MFDCLVYLAFKVLFFVSLLMVLEKAGCGPLSI